MVLRNAKTYKYPYGYAEKKQLKLSKIEFVFHIVPFGLTPELRHRHRRLTLAAMMIFKFHGPVKTEGAVAVACTDLLGIVISINQNYSVGNPGLPP